MKENEERRRRKKICDGEKEDLQICDGENALL